MLTRLCRVSLSLAGDVVGMIDPGLRVVALPDLGGMNVRALLGRDILNHCLIVYDGPGRLMTLAFDRPPF